jgi:hypothetical protein
MDPRFLSFTLLVVALLSFLSVVVWSRERRREREAYYRSEALRTIAASQGATSTSILEVLREEEKISARRRREGHKLAGFVTIAAALGMMLFLKVVDRNDPDPAYMAGLIPLFVGIALLTYGYVLGPKE